MNALSCGKELSVSWTFSSELLRQKQGNRKATHDYDEQEESRNERDKNILERQHFYLKIFLFISKK